jgi:glucose/arabinose dehydrogenase
MLRWVGLLFCVVSEALGSVPFVLQGPGVNPAHFRVTEFATGLNYPLGMAVLSDGSLLVTSTDGPGYFNSAARLVRLMDANQDGKADGPATVLFSDLNGGLTSLRISGRLVFVTGQAKPIYVLRLGATPTEPLTQVGRIDITDSSGWLHPHSGLATRPTPGASQSHDLFFQLGSKANFSTTTQTASFTTTGLGGLSGALPGDSIYRLTLVDHGTSVTATNMTQIARGLRNPAGFAFHPSTGDFYFEDNGIDGLVNSSEPLSADELNVLPAASLDASGSASVPFYGFPTNYTAYRTGVRVGGQGLQPLVAFQPQPDPMTGEESEGPNEITFAPAAFPDELNNGIFVSFHGQFSQGGLNNEENALVFVNLATTNYFHLIPSRQPGIGHLDGLLATTDSLYVSDISTNGNFSSSSGRGVIYQIKALVGPTVKVRWQNDKIELRWNYGVLQNAADVRGGWMDVTNVSPYTIEPSQPRQFFRTRN